MRRSRPRTDNGLYFRRAFAAAAGASLALGLALVAWFGAQILLLAFAGALLAVLVRAPADALTRRTRLPPRLSVAVVVLGALGLAALGVRLAIPGVVEQAERLAVELPRAFRLVREEIEGTVVGGALRSFLRGTDDLAWGALLAPAAGVLSTVAGVLVALLVFFSVGLFLALSPDVYRENLVRLVPPRRRRRARQVLDELGRMLRLWLYGRLAAMAFIGVLAGTGLWALGVPLALVLGVLAGALDFIPNLGPVLAALPAILLAVPQGASQVALVTALYLGIQALENNVVAPLIEQKMVRIPPAVTILAQVLLGLAFGILGLFLATPLTVCAVLLVRRLYLEGALGDRS